MDRDPRKWRRLYVIQGSGALCFIAGMTAFFSTRDELFVAAGIMAFVIAGLVSWTTFWPK